MGKDWDKDLNLQALEDFFEDPLKYFHDQRVIDFVRAFMCPSDNECKMIMRSEDEFLLAEIMTKNNNRVLLSGLIDKKINDPYVITKLED